MRTAGLVAGYSLKRTVGFLAYLQIFLNVGYSKVAIYILHIMNK
jgi:hypothetical protein